MRNQLQKVLEREDFGVKFHWWVADEYAVENDCIVVKKASETETAEPEDPVLGELERASEEFGGRPTTPLTDPDLFVKFSKVGSVMYPEKRILPWVKRFGLLKRTGRGDGSAAFLDSGELDQAPMPIGDFIMEAREAHSAAQLYYTLNQGDSNFLKEKIRGLEDKGKERALSNIEQRLLCRFKKRSRRRIDGEFTFNDNTVMLLASMVLEGHMTRKLSSVRLSFWNENPLLIGPSPAYRPTVSFKCPDLLSALYLQFYVLMTGTLPMRLCDNPHCRNPLPVTRKDRRFCSPGCRSTGRPSRRNAS